MSFSKYLKKNFIKPIDYFGKSLEFNIMGKTKINSLCGGILTLILGSIFLCIFSYNINKFLKFEPIVTLYNQALDLNNVQDMTFDFKFLTTILQLNKTKKFPILSLPFNSESNNFNTDLNKYEYLEIGNFTSCNNVNHNFTDYNITFNEVGKEYFTCFNLYDYEKKVKMGGSIFGDEGQYEISLYYYQNISKSDDGFTFIFSIMNNIIDVDKTLGFTNFLDSYSIWIEKGSKITITDRIVKNVIFSDINYIYNFLAPIESSFYTHNIEMVDHIKYNNEMVIEIEIIFHLNTIYNLYNRSYMNIDTLLANSLSVIQAFIILLQIVDCLINNQTLENKLIKCLYRIEDEKNILENLSQRRGNIISSNSLRNINLTLISSKINSVNTSTLNNQIKRNKQSNSILKIGSKLLEYDLNIIFILRKLIEYENLKYILLEDYQLKCLRITNRRLLSIYNQEKLNKKINEENYSNNILGLDYLFKKQSPNSKDIKLKEILI